MDPSQARCRPAPASRPPAIPLFEPVEWTASSQPPLPWGSGAEVVDATAFVPAELRRTARDLASALIETLSSRRPLHQLEPWLSTEVLALVERLRPGQASRQLRLLSLRTQHPKPDVIEVTLHLRQAGHSRAAAFRLTQMGGRWRITQLAIALDPPLVHDARRLLPTAG